MKNMGNSKKSFVDLRTWWKIRAINFKLARESSYWLKTCLLTKSLDGRGLKNKTKAVLKPRLRFKRRSLINITRNSRQMKWETHTMTEIALDKWVIIMIKITTRWIPKRIKGNNNSTSKNQTQTKNKSKKHQIKKKIRNRLLKLTMMKWDRISREILMHMSNK